MPTVQVIGDVHGHMDRMIEIVDSKADFVLQTGDLGVVLPKSNLSNIPRRYRNELGQFAEYLETRKP